MANRIEGERVFCYQCENEWDRAQGGLQCPRCHSEFVEILEAGRHPEAEDPPEVDPESHMDIDNHPLRELDDHNPWGSPDPDEGDLRTIQFGRRGGPASFSFTRTTYHDLGGPHHQRTYDSGTGDPVADDLMRNFEGMVNNILGGSGNARAANFGGGSHFGGSMTINGRTTTFGSGTRDADFPGMGPGPPDLFSMLLGPNAGGRGAQNAGMAGPFGMGGFLSMLMDPSNARSGDAVFTSEAFDRVMSQLMEQNQSNGAPPASEDLISQLPKRPIDKSMLGDDGKAECSICMDNVEIGSEVTVLPCTHWFHFECIESWLKEHDTCPHCRKPITPEDRRRLPQNRNSSIRSSSVASPQIRTGEGNRQNPVSLDSPSAIRNAREQYYGRQRDTEPHDSRPSSERRRSSRRSTGGREEGSGSGGGVASWIRNHIPFSGA